MSSEHLQYLDIRMGSLDENIADLAFIDQTLKIHNAIPVGSLPMLPETGSPVPLMVDAPVNGEFLASVRSGTYEALNDLFSEVQITEVKVEDDNGTTRITPVMKYSGDLTT